MADQRISDRPVEEFLDSLRQDCTQLEVPAEAIATPDLNGDGLLDLVLTKAVMCDGFSSMFCGTAGCTTEIWFAQGDGDFTLAVDDNLWRVQAVSFHGKPAMRIDVHGMHCDRVGAEGCIDVWGWDGARLVMLWNDYQEHPPWPERSQSD